jgi:hypothetical protein
MVWTPSRIIIGRSRVFYSGKYAMRRVIGLDYDSKTGVAQFTYKATGSRIEQRISQCVTPEKCP